LTKEV